MNNTKIKICGIKDTRLIDELTKLNIDFIGINFIESSKRFINSKSAKAISQKLSSKKTKIKLVGLFQDHDKSLVNELSNDLNLDYVQLCGNESIEYLEGLEKKIIKTIHIKKELEIEEINQKINLYLEKSDYVILDTYSKSSSGGTGVSFNWDKYKTLFNKRVFVAGGLNPKNIGDLIKSHNPWGVDVSSGVEHEGEKSIKKIKDFIKFKEK